MAMNRRRSGGFPAFDSLINVGLSGGFSSSSRCNDEDEDFNDDHENLFESIGRALDHCEEIDLVRTGAQHSRDRRKQLSVDGSSNSRESPMDGSDIIADNSSGVTVSNPLLHTQEKEQGKHRSEQSQIHAACNQKESIINTHSKNTPTRDSTTTQFSHVSTERKVSPHRFTFQTSAKPKSTSFKTPSRRSLPTEDLFSLRAMSQRVTTNRSARKSISSESTQKRNHRHTFRNSTDFPSVPAAENNVREMRFVPTFLGNSKVGSVNAHEDMPGENDDDAYHPHHESSPFAHNIVTDYHRQQQQLNQSHRKSEQTAGTSGYLVQRLRSLRNADQRMSMQLRSGRTPCASMPRKRRLSGSGDYFDPTKSAATIMDVTVSGMSQSVYEFDEGKTVLVAYIHCYTVIEDPSKRSEDQCDGLSFPCYALILMSRDLVQELDIIGSGSKQLRIYDAVVVPPCVAALDRNTASDERDPDRDVPSYDTVPVIVRTQLCKEKPTSAPVPDVTFPPPWQNSRNDFRF